MFVYRLAFHVCCTKTSGDSYEEKIISAPFSVSSNSKRSNAADIPHLLALKPSEVHRVAVDTHTAIHDRVFATAATQPRFGLKGGISEARKTPLSDLVGSLPYSLKCMKT
jgi:hypothetical protein